jgi:hypothetical protein
VETEPAQPAAPSAFCDRWKPWQFAAAFTAALRLLYSIYGAFWSSRLEIDPRLLQSNGFTGHLMPRSDGFLYALLGVWERFDTLWYIHIAQHGYDRPAAIVFYPLYPLLIRVATWLIHPPLAAALAVATLAAFFSFWGLQQLLELDYPRSTAIRAVFLAGIWPASCILLAGYAESLVLAFTVWSLYFARQERWYLAGLLGFLGGASKAVGCFVALPLAWIGLRQRTWRCWTAGLALAPPAAFALWNRLSGFGSVNDVYPRYWAVTVRFPLVTLAHCLAKFFTGGADVLFLLNFGALVAIGCLAWKSARTDYKLYTAALILLFLTKHADPLLNETLRYVLVVFPAFLGLALVVKRPTTLAMLSVLLLLLQGLLLLTFFQWSLVI